MAVEPRRNEVQTVVDVVEANLNLIGAALDLALERIVQLLDELVVFLAVGDAFTLLSGRRPFAPAWMQRMGLTWLFRLSSEPLRLGPRYLRYNLTFLFYLVWDGLRGRLFKHPGGTA